MLTSVLKSTFAHIPEGLRVDISKMYNVVRIADIHTQRRCAVDCKIPYWFRRCMHLNLGVSTADLTCENSTSVLRSTFAHIPEGSILDIATM